MTTGMVAVTTARNARAQHDVGDGVVAARASADDDLFVSQRINFARTDPSLDLGHRINQAILLRLGIYMIGLQWAFNTYTNTVQSERESEESSALRSMSGLSNFHAIREGGDDYDDRPSAALEPSDQFFMLFMAFNSFLLITRLGLASSSWDSETSHTPWGVYRLFLPPRSPPSVPHERQEFLVVISVLMSLICLESFKPFLLWSGLVYLICGGRMKWEFVALSLAVLWMARCALPEIVG